LQDATLAVKIVQSAAGKAAAWAIGSTPTEAQVSAADRDPCDCAEQDARPSRVVKKVWLWPET